MDKEQLELEENVIISLGLVKHEFELETLVRNCEELERLVLQKTQVKKGDIDLSRIISEIVVDAVMLVRKMKEKGLI